MVLDLSDDELSADCNGVPTTMINHRISSATNTHPKTDAHHQQQKFFSIWKRRTQPKTPCHPNYIFISRHRTGTRLNRLSFHFIKMTFWSFFFPLPHSWLYTPEPLGNITVTVNISYSNAMIPSFLNSQQFELLLRKKQLEPKIKCDKDPGPLGCSSFRQPLYDLSFVAKAQYSTVLNCG